MLSQPVLPPAHAKLGSKAAVTCHDPSTGAFLDVVVAASDADVEAAVGRARAAQKVWASSSFATRRRLLRTISRATLDHVETIVRVSARDSGKTLTDAAFGEVYVSLEKLAWLCDEGEAALRPEFRTRADLKAKMCAAWRHKQDYRDEGVDADLGGGSAANNNCATFAAEFFEMIAESEVSN